MKQITKPNQLPEWFTISGSKAQFSAKEIALLLGCCTKSVRTHLSKQESFESIGNHRPSSTKPTKYFTKQTVLNLIKTLPTGEQ